MEYRNFGSSDLRVSVVGFGCWPMGGDRYGSVEDEEEISAVHRALELGITCFDTAAGYGLGHSEQVLGRALGPRRKDVVVVSKCGVVWNPATKTFDRDSSKEHILKAIDESLANLGTDYLDLFLIHWPDPNTPIEETMTALKDLIQQGKIRYAGVSNYLPDRLAEARKTLGIVCNQVGYHLFDRRIERETAPFCRREGMGIMAYGSLAHGVLTGTMTPENKFEANDWRAGGTAFGLPLFKPGHFEKNLEAVERLKAIAKRMGRPLPQVATAWVLREPAVAVALIGFRRPTEVEAAVEAAGLKLGPNDLEDVDAISRKVFKRLSAEEEFQPKSGPPNAAGQRTQRG